MPSNKVLCMFCHGHCPQTATIQDGKLVKVEADKSHPAYDLYNRVITACPRARHTPEWFYHPDRLRHVLKRAGDRGSGKWQRISWEQALDEIAEKISGLKDRYGAETLATSSGTYRTADEYRTRFTNLFGTPNNIGQGQICYAPTNLTSTIVLGWPTNFTRIHRETRCMLLLGMNPPLSIRLQWLPMLDAKKDGAKLIVVDPRRTEAAAQADIWLQLRPGTDSALYLGMINIIITEKLYDEDFVSNWCHGFDKLAERAGEYPLEKVSQITGVPEDKILEATHMMAANRPITVFDAMGLEHLENSIEALHGRFIIPALLGSIDVRGGVLIRPPHPKFISEHEIELNGLLTPEQKKKFIPQDRFKLGGIEAFEMIMETAAKVHGKAFSRCHTALAHAPSVFRTMITGEPYPVRALITLSSNPMVTMANVKLVYQALRSLDLYVVMDYWMTPSAELADYILPAASFLERPNVFSSNGLASYVQACEAIFPPAYERRTDFDFWKDLGTRLGQEQYWPWKTLEESYDERLAPMGYTLKEFINQKGGYETLRGEYKKYEKTGFATPTGKVEFYSTTLEKLGYDPLPNYKEAHETPISAPEVAKEYPYMLLTGGRILPYYHSEHRQIESMRKQRRDPTVQINPETAVKNGIEKGDWVWIESPRGRIRQRCEYFDGIAPDVIHVEHGWWFPELPGEEPWLRGVWESNCNVLTNDDPDVCNQINGGWPLRTGLCKIYKAKKWGI